jgi:hypothetical protein
MTTPEVIDRSVDAAKLLAELRKAKSFRDVHELAARLARVTADLAELETYFPAAAEHLLAAVVNRHALRDLRLMTNAENLIEDWAAQLVGAAEAVAHGA